MKSQEAAWDRWERVFGSGAASREVFDDLARRYDHPKRAYHNRVHIQAMLEALEARWPGLAESRALIAAIWFHDAVYNPHLTTSERRSARLARKVLPRLGFSKSESARVAELILLTRDHEAPGGDAEAQALLDLDLLILASDPDEYRAYSSAIRAEVRPLPWTLYRSARRAFLRGMLSRAKLFHSAGMEAEDARARENLLREFDELSRRSSLSRFLPAKLAPHVPELVAIGGLVLAMWLVAQGMIGWAFFSILGAVALFKQQQMSAWRRWTIVSDWGVRVDHGRNGRDEVAWDELTKAEILTTDEGPFVCDVFLVLHKKSGGCVVPQEDPAFNRALELISTRPGYDPKAVIEAMGSAQLARFTIWQATDGGA